MIETIIVLIKANWRKILPVGAGAILLLGAWVSGNSHGHAKEAEKWQKRIAVAEAKVKDAEAQSQAQSQYWQQWAASEVAKAQKHTATTAQHIQQARPQLDVNGPLPDIAVQLFNESARNR